MKVDFSNNTIEWPTVWSRSLPSSASEDKGKILFRESDGMLIYANDESLVFIRDDGNISTLLNEVSISGNGGLSVALSGQHNPEHIYLRHAQASGKDLNPDDRIFSTSSSSSSSSSSSYDEHHTSSSSSSSNSFPSGLLVSGTLTPDVTGTYHRNGFYNGTSAYTNGSYWIWWNGVTDWRISSAKGLLGTGWKRTSPVITGSYLVVAFVAGTPTVTAI